MKLFLDTASIEEIRTINAWGVLDGVTTNPTLLAKEKNRGQSWEQIVKEICAEVEGPVSAEVVATEWTQMLDEGRTRAQLADNVYVKLPCTPDGLRACKVLRGEDICVNMTLVFSPTQALLAAKAGANLISPFVGRIDDAASGGIEILAQVVDIVAEYPTEVLAASLRHPMHVVESAQMGAHIATMPFEVFEKLVKHPLTDIGLKRFLQDWEQAKEALQG